MALENATYISQLVETNPGDTDTVGQGGAQLRLLKAVLLATFPNLSGPVTGTPDNFNDLTAWLKDGGLQIAAPTDDTTATNGAFTVLKGQSNNADYRVQVEGTSLAVAVDTAQTGTFTDVMTISKAGVVNLIGSGAGLTFGGASPTVPIGGVIMYTGSLGNLPSNWKLCDGTNGTPNLKDKFIIGSGGNYATGAGGGNTSVTLQTANLPAHNHGVNDPGHGHGVNDPGHGHGMNDPGHGHGMDVGWGYDDNANGGNRAPAVLGHGPNAQWQTYNATTGIGINSSSTGITMNTAKTGITTQSVGSGNSFSILPPYYALAFIMRVS